LHDAITHRGDSQTAHILLPARLRNHPFADGERPKSLRLHVIANLSEENSHASALFNGLAVWPLMVTPDMAVHGENATVFGPEQSMSYKDADSLWTWLPFWNTIILLTSSVTVHFAHSAILNNQRKAFNNWLGATIVLAIVFLCLQVYEYYEAYVHMGLTLQSGIYGTTFFMLTGFHGLHVFLGTFMLAVMWFRSVLKGHFKQDDHFGFEAASWYWHFVDVVWVGLVVVEEDGCAQAVGQCDEGFNRIGVVGLCSGEFRDVVAPASRGWS
jgi:heme/copper-type cytochrome/quinol oxidase subunit 3